jgi:hypothetical protein
LLAAALLAGSAGAFAADEGARWYLQIDNDVVFGTDRWYTSGVRLARVASHGDHEVEWGLTQEVYTPEAKRFAPGVTDRLPSARLLLSAARHDRLATCFQTIELALGVRGPSARGRESTDLIHQVIPAPEVDWSQQEGDRFDGQVAFVRSHSFRPLVLHYGASLGSQLALAHVGAELRTGAGAGPEISTGLMRFASTPPLAQGRGWGAFAGLSARVIARNELLQRGYGDGAPIERNRFVSRLAAGLTWAQGWGSVAFTLAQDSREFEGQRTPHRFGSLAVHVGF